MIENIRINNFRSFRKLEMNDLKRITLISGRNNVGKSTVLEALFLLKDHSATDSFFKLGSFRGLYNAGMDSLWNPLFNDSNPDDAISITVDESGKTAKLAYRKDKNYIPNAVEGVSDDSLVQFINSAKSTYSLNVAYEEDDYKESGHFFLNGSGGILREFKSNQKANKIKEMTPTRYLNVNFARQGNAILNDIGRIELNGEKDKVIDILQLLDPAIEDIITLSVQGVTQLYIKSNGRLIPLQYAGDGVIMLLNICIAIMETQNGLVLIDEIETGFHYSMYGKLLNMIDTVSKEANCQVIATTHSYEMISSVNGNIKQSDFAYIRLNKKEQQTESFNYTYAMLEQALDSDMEVR